MSRKGFAALICILASITPCAAAQPTIPANEFWDLYYENRLLVLKHDGALWSGRAANDSNAKGPSPLLQKGRSFEFLISDEAFRGYNYGRDERFALIAIVPSTTAAAFHAIIEQSYPYRDSPPFSRRRMAELFSEIATRFNLNSTKVLTIDDCEQALLGMITARQAAGDQGIAALVWFLGERRQRSSSGAIVEVLRHSAYVRPTDLQVHFTAVDVAFSALWKIDDKSKLKDLISLMGQSDSTGRRKFAALFERLLSTRELLSLDTCGSGWLTPEFWARQSEPYQQYKPTDWNRYDARSLFWELRYLAATRADVNDPILRTLARDVVETVRHQANQRLGLSPVK